MSIHKDISEIVFETRTKWGMTQDEFAFLAGMSGKYISAIENKRKIPPPETEKLLRHVIETKPTKPANFRRARGRRSPDKIESEIRRWVRGSNDVFQDFAKQQPDGTNIFVLSVYGLLEAENTERLQDVFELLDETNATRICYCYPKEDSWPNELGFHPSMQAGRQRVVAGIERIKNKLKACKLRKQALDRIASKELPNSHWFHPVAKLILYLTPPTTEETDWSQQAMLEFPLPSGPIWLPLGPEATASVIWWLEACGVKTQ